MLGCLGLLILGLIILILVSCGADSGTDPGEQVPRVDPIPSVAGYYDLTHGEGQPLPAVVDTLKCRDQTGALGVLLATFGTLTLLSDSTASFQLSTRDNCYPVYHTSRATDSGSWGNVKRDSTLVLYFDAQFQPFVSSRIVPGGQLRTTYRVKGNGGTVATSFELSFTPK